MPSVFSTTGNSILRWVRNWPASNELIWPSVRERFGIFPFFLLTRLSTHGTVANFNPGATWAVSDDHHTGSRFPAAGLFAWGWGSGSCSTFVGCGEVERDTVGP